MESNKALTVLPAEFDLRHETMDVKIGYPAVLFPGDTYPVVTVLPHVDGLANVRLVNRQTGAVVVLVEGVPVTAAKEASIALPGKAELPGPYGIEVTLLCGGRAEMEDQFTFTVITAWKEGSSKTCYVGDDGRMVYIPDYRGNRLPDFSGVGYKGGGVPIPNVPVKVTVEPVDGDCSALIQEAIDKVSLLPLDENGFRGAILLKKGVYEIATFVEVKESGIVLRGEGQGEFKRLWHDPDSGMSLEQFKEFLRGKDATILLATGSERRRILKIHGSGERVRLPETESAILDHYVPVGANTFRVANPELFQVGDPIIVQRNGNAAWISEIGMDRIPPRGDGGSIKQWEPFNLEFEHVITAIDGNRITIDSSLMNAIETKWGGGLISKFEYPGRINQVGVEHLRAIAFWQPNADGVDDTRHADQFVEFDHMTNGWVRHTTAEHFNSVHGAYLTQRGSKWITIEDSSALVADKKFYNGKGYDPSGRTFYETKIYVGRYGFYLIGQSGLVQRCFALHNRHGFTLGSRVTGPNVFTHCEGEKRLTWSEPHHRWSVGGLYDNVNDMISIMNRLNMGSGHGWAGANYVAWNTEGTLVTHQPPTAQNWAIGHIGVKDVGGNRGPDGFWDSHGAHVEPRSLYVQQLKDRLGEQALRDVGYM